AALAGAFGDLPLGVVADQAEASDRRHHRRQRQLAPEELDRSVGIVDVVENSLPEEIAPEQTLVPPHRGGALGGAHEVMPRLGGHSMPRELAQIAEAHRGERLFCRRHQLEEAISHQLRPGSLSRNEVRPPSRVTSRNSVRPRSLPVSTSLRCASSTAPADSRPIVKRKLGENAFHSGRTAQTTYGLLAGCFT